MKQKDALKASSELYNNYLFYIFLFLIFSLFYFWPILKCNQYLLNWDSFAHFSFTQTLIEGLKNRLLFPPLFIFGGISYFPVYPPLFYYLVAFFYFIFKGILSLNTIWNLSLYLIVTALGLSSFFLFKKLKVPPFFAFLFATLLVLFRISPCCGDFGASNIFGIGLIAFSLSWVWVPIWLGYFIESLNFSQLKSKALFSAFLSSVFAALTFYSHSYTFLIIEVFTLLFWFFSLIKIENRKNLIILFFSFHLFLLIFVSPYLLYYFKNHYQFLNTLSVFSYQELKQRFFQVFNPFSKDGVDFKFFMIEGGGIIFLVLMTFSLFNKKREEKYNILMKLLLSYVVIIFIFIFGIDYFNIKFPYEFAYAHTYGRILAFVKYFYLLFGVLGFYLIYEYFFKKKSHFILLLFVLGLLGMLFINIKESKNYTVFNCFDLINDPISKEFQQINSYLDFDKGGVFLIPGVDFYYQYFLLGEGKGIRIYSEAGAWWPTFKLRQYSFKLFDLYKTSNFNQLLKWFNDLGINYIISLSQKEDFTRLNFHLVYRGKFLELWENNHPFPVTQLVSNLGLIIDDEMYFKNFDRALAFYKDYARENLNWAIVQSKDLKNIEINQSYLKFILLGKISSCDKVKQFLAREKSIESSLVPIFSLSKFNQCKIGKEIDEADLASYLDQMKFMNFLGDIKTKLEIENLWKYKIKTLKDLPIVLKINYDKNWEVIQDNKKVSTILVLPQNILILPFNDKEIIVRYQNDPYMIALILTILGGVLVVFGYYFKKQIFNHYELKKDLFFSNKCNKIKLIKS